MPGNRRGLWVALALVGALALAPVWTGSASGREAAFTVLLGVVLASSLNLLLGYTGYVSFGHIVFFGLGGYVGFWLVGVRGWHLAPAALAGGAAAGLLALLLGLSILRLRGTTFALATIGVCEATRAFVTNFAPWGGATGMELNLRTYAAYGGAARALGVTYAALAGLAVAVLLVSYAVRYSRYGLGLLAIREDEDAAEVMGVVAPRAKTWAYVLSAVGPGIAGALFFFKNGMIQPDSAFRLDLSVELLVMVMLGGQGTVLGPVLGAAAYQHLRSALLTAPFFRDIQLAAAGLVLLLLVLFAPAGAVGWLRARADVLRRSLA